MALQSFQQLTGANYFFYYGATIFTSVGLADSFVTQIILGAVNFGCTFGGLFVMQRVSLFVWSLGILTYGNCLPVWPTQTTHHWRSMAVYLAFCFCDSRHSQSSPRSPGYRKTYGYLCDSFHMSSLGLLYSDDCQRMSFHLGLRHDLGSVRL